MSKNLNACKGCKDRKPLCHSTCEKYKEQQAYHKKIREAKKFENDFHDYSVKIVIRNKGFSGERRF